MSWAAQAIKTLSEGKPAQIRPRGHSMTGRINDGDLVTLLPVTDPSVLVVDTAVLCRVNGKEYLHLITAVQGNRYLIGNNRGGVNGWTGFRNIYGIVSKVER